ncbi:hypothetical protein MPSEU_000954000 [Mayamaea pseudoterrestris]|nr:hypothetical protein MPSEU_000954000 [Mayamaea pseudoterrestris]
MATTARRPRTTLASPIFGVVRRITIHQRLPSNVMRFGALVKSLRSLKHDQHHDHGKKDDSTFDSNDLYDMVTVMETKGDDIEQSLSKSDDDELQDESLEVILPIAWGPSIEERGGGDDDISSSVGMMKEKEDGELDKAMGADSGPLNNLVVFKVESESLNEESYEIAPVDYNVQIKDASSRHPIEEIAVIMPMNRNRSESCNEESVEVTESIKIDDFGMTFRGLFDNDIQRWHLEDLKKISERHIALVKDASYIPGAILGDDYLSCITSNIIKANADRLSAVQDMMSTFVDATSSIVNCCQPEMMPAPVNGDDESVLAIYERQHSIDMISSEMPGAFGGFDAGKQLRTKQEGHNYGRQLVRDSDDSTISTHLSMQQQF